MEHAALNMNELNGGKGLTRVEIAQRAWEKAQGKADAALERLNLALEAAKTAGTKKPKLHPAEKAARALEKAGMQEMADKARAEAGIEAGDSPELEQVPETLITTYYEAIDSDKVTEKTYKTLKGASTYARKMVGDSPAIAAGMAASLDGAGTLTVDGCKLEDLF